MIRLGAVRPHWMGLTFGLFLLVVLGGALLSTQAPRSAAALANQPPMPTPGLPGPGVAVPGPQGIPAIQPHAALAASSGPHFTEADVRQYFATHPYAAQSVPSAPVPVIVSIQFLPASQVSALLQGESMGVPDTTLLCLVRLSGTFEAFSPPLLLPGTPTPAPFHETVEVFDAHTGNLLIG
ncbi:MAG: hypothetical protein IVW57_16080 [Ktedonobacterales bacterium]|nr:hypothetical protein [Ktedonobacterales bacterium]